MQEVETFLSQMLARSRPKAKAELALLSDAKRAAEGCGQVEPWDRTYYMGLVKGQKYRIDANMLTAHFRVENCLTALVGIRPLPHATSTVTFNMVPCQRTSLYNPCVIV